jgi:hypothetical protein
MNPHLLIVVPVATSESFVSVGSQFYKPIPSIYATTIVLLIQGIILPYRVDFLCTALGRLGQITYTIVVFLPGGINLLGCSRYIVF